ncbi:hypothetical protein MY10362_004181 [Beauveria mimosiformis]
MSSLVGSLVSYVDFGKRSLLASLPAKVRNRSLFILQSPSRDAAAEKTNEELTDSTPVVAEYRNKILTKLFGGNRTVANYALAATIFSIGLVRDFLYKTAIFEQPAHPALQDNVYVQAASYALLAAGNILVVTSTWQLGIRGTFLGDYFGFLQERMVTGFPFSVTSAPMYWGSTMSFLGTALLFGRPAGVLLTGEVLLVYLVALRFEDPFTAGIYAKRDRERAAAKAGKKSE